MREIKTSCDVCGKVKGEVDRWLKGYNKIRGWFSVGITELQGLDENCIDLCSDACMQKALAEAIELMRKGEENATAG